MNLLDYGLILLIAISVITAAGQGLVYELWMMAAAVAAVGVAAWNYEVLAAHLGTWGSPAMRHVAAFLLLLAAVLVVASLLGRLLRGAVHGLGLKWPDRVLGAGLGLVRGVLLAAAILMVWTAAWPCCGARFLRESRLAPRLAWASRGLAACLPHDWPARFAAGRAALERSVE